jgi:hypothetical protein
MGSTKSFQPAMNIILPQATTPTRAAAKPRAAAKSVAAAGRKRNRYAAGERLTSLGRLTTRAPTILRDYLRHAASNPALGYRSFTHMVTDCLLDFIKAAASKDIAWARGRAAGDDTVLIHANTERKQVDGIELDGTALAERAMAAANVHDVNMSSFTLTLLFWIATVKHPASDKVVKRTLETARKASFAS